MNTQANDFPVSSRKLVTDSQLIEATGRSRRAWFALLDEAGAREWDHQRVLRWLGGKHDVDSWWAQSVTVEYQNLHGNHSPARNREKFFASATGLYLASFAQVWELVDDDELRRSWLDLEFTPISEEPGDLRFHAHDGSDVQISIMESIPDTRGQSTTRVVVQHKGLPSADIVEETTNFWNFALDELAAALNIGFSI